MASIALWDIVGKALNTPVYRLIGGKTKDRIPCYCTGNDFEQHVEFGFKRLKCAIPHGPADGIEGMRKNEAVVKTARELVGPDGDVMCDYWMAWTERYTIEWLRCWSPTASTGWRRFSSRTIMQASAGCAKRSSPLAS
ncbi:MAG: hypothetical protein IT167_23930 [Bryobacterales bacterium]|nr:hypothetical protein [Bryobacterales bacterium]